MSFRLSLRSMVTVFGICLTLSCRMQDICTVTVDIPDMKNAECQQRIRSALQTAEGVMPNTISFGSNCVSVTYDSMKTAIKNIEFVIADAGFTANDIPANPTARAALPPECR